uniref:Uncharacterized protein n=1 Tax=Anguilla anguilla TaxID=7936 RepID=A0A0E9WY49_ANGAN
MIYIFKHPGLWATVRDQFHTVGPPLHLLIYQKRVLSIALVLGKFSDFKCLARLIILSSRGEKIYITRYL